MDLIKEALSMGFADAAIMDTKDLVFVPEYRQFSCMSAYLRYCRRNAGKGIEI